MNRFTILLDMRKLFRRDSQAWSKADASKSHYRIASVHCTRGFKSLSRRSILDLKNEILDLKNEVLDLKNEVLDLKNEVLDLKNKKYSLISKINNPTSL